MNPNPKTKRNMTFSANDEVITKYKAYCKENNINQSLMIETFLRDFYEGRLKAVYKNNKFYIKEDS